tara:strand:- start:21 stop:152 length:132 start_codon:yes stop_codon:yes gene_type:complete
MKSIIEIYEGKIISKKIPNNPVKNVTNKMIDNAIFEEKLFINL